MWSTTNDLLTEGISIVSLMVLLVHCMVFVAVTFAISIWSSPANVGQGTAHEGIEVF